MTKTFSTFKHFHFFHLFSRYAEDTQSTINFLLFSFQGKFIDDEPGIIESIDLVKESSIGAR